MQDTPTPMAALATLHATDSAQLRAALVGAMLERYNSGNFVMRNLHPSIMGGHAMHLEEAFPQIVDVHNKDQLFREFMGHAQAQVHPEHVPEDLQTILGAQKAIKPGEAM